MIIGRKISFNVLVLIAAIVISNRCNAQVTITSAQSGNWTSASTWVGGVVPSTTAHDNVIIATGHTVTYSSGNTSSTQYGAVTVSGTFIDNGTFHCNSFSGNGNTYSTISGITYIQTGYNNTDFTYSGVIGPGAISIVKNGTGIWTLSGNNTFTSNLTIGSGSFLNAAHSNALGAGAGVTTISTYGTLLLSGGVTINETINVSGNGSTPANLGAIRSTSGSNTITGEITSSGSTKFTADAGAQLIISTPMTASSIGSLTLMSTDAASTISINSTFERNSTLTLDGAGDGIFSGKIGSTATVIKNGAGTWLLSGDNSYTGNTTINQGTLKAGIANTAFGIGSAITITNNTSNASAVLDLNNYNQTVGSLFCSTMGTVSLGSGTLTFGTNNTNQTSLTALITGTGNIVKVGTGIATLNSANTFTGTTTISAGTININTSSMANSSGAFGNSNNNIILGDANTTLNNSSASLYINGNNLNIGRNILVSNNPTSGVYTIGSLGNSAVGTNTISGSINYNQPFTISGGTAVTGNSAGFVLSGSITSDNSTSKTITTTAGVASNIITISGSIDEGSGVTSIVSTSPGQVILGAANNYTGKTTIQNGIIAVQHSNALGSSLNETIVNSGTALHIQGGITILSEPLTISGTGISSGGAIRNISGTNNINGPITIVGSIARINADAGTLTFSNTATLTGTDADVYFGGASTSSGINYNGAISIGAGNIFKDGAGTCQLACQLNLTGNTTINAGAIKAGAAISFPTKLIIAAGKFDCSTYHSTAYQLTLGAAMQNAGTYGGTGSTATTINNVYFQTGASGKLTVAHGNCNAGSIASNQTICSGTTASAFISLSAGTGATGTTITYKWQLSTTSPTTGFNDIPGATSLTYNPGVVFSDTWYIRTVISTNGSDVCTENTPVVKVSTVAIPNEGAIGVNQTIFYNQIPSTITSLTNGSGLPIINYIWEQKTSGTWSTISGQTAADYSPGNLIESTQFRRYVVGTGSGINCISPVSNIVEVTVKFPQYSGGEGRGDVSIISPEIGEISGSQSICYGATAQINSISISDAIKGAVISYKWEKSESPYTNWSILAGENNSQLNTTSLTQTTKFRRITIATNGAVVTESLPTVPVTITVYSPFVIGSISSNQTICYNSTPAQLTGQAPSGSTGSYAYEWEKYNTSLLQWEVIPGETGINLTINSALQETTKYRQKQNSGSSCGVGYTNEVTITVRPLFSAGSILSTGESLCYGADPAIIPSNTLATGGDNTISYQWQSKNMVGSYADILGASASSYDPPYGIAETMIFRRLAKDGTCNAFSASTGEWIITVYPLLPASIVISSSAVNNTICQGESVTFTATSTNGGTAPQYQWKLNGQNIGTNSNTFTSNALNNGDVVVAELTSNAAPCLTSSPATSNSIATTVNLITTITEQPSSIEICYADARPTFSVSVSASSPINYQWYENNSLSNVGGSIIPGAVSSSYTVPETVTVTPGIRYYYASIQGACQNVKSIPVSVRTYPALSITLNNAASITLCNNTSTALSATASGSTGVYSYQWYLSSSNNINSGMAIPGATASTYSVPATMNAGDRYFFVKVISAPCNETSSSVVKVTTTNSLTISTNPESKTICNNTSTTINGNAIGGSSNYSYSWFSNSIPVNYGGSAIAGANSSTYTIPSTTSPGNRYYYLVIADATDSLCGTVVTGVSTITNRNALGILIQPTSNQRICNNSSAGLSIIATGSTGNYSYQWYKNTSNSITGGSSINNATTPNYETIPVINSGASFYYAEVTDSGCNEIATSTIAEVFTLDTLSVRVQPVLTQSLCNNTAVTISTEGAGGNQGAYKYQWYLTSSPSNYNGSILQGATTSAYQVPATLTAGSRFYYAIITDTICAQSIKTRIAEIITNSSLSIRTQPQDSIAICNNTVTTLAVTPQGGSGNYHYQWYVNSNKSNSGGVLISGATSSNYLIPASIPSGNRYYYVIVTDNTSNSCTVPSEVSVVHTYSVMSINSQPINNQTLCNNASSILSINVEGSASVFTYQWYSNSTNSITGGQPINNAINSAFTVPASLLAGDRFFYVKVEDAVCSASAYSTISTIHTLDSLKITSQPVAQANICFNSPTSLTFSGIGGSGNYSYQWYQNIMNTTTGGVIIPGATSLQFNVPATVSQGDRYYYANLIDNICSVSKTSNTATITNLPEFRIVTQPLNSQTICNGASTNLNVEKTGGSGQITYQWYQNTINSTTGAIPIAGATNDNFTVPGTSFAGDRFYFVKITDAQCGLLTSNIAIVSTRTLPSFVLQPMPIQQVCNSSVATLTALATGGVGIFTYQWYINNQQSYTGATPISGANSNVLQTIPRGSAGNDYYYLKITDASCGSTINSIISTVTTIDTLSITQQPQNAQIICNNTSAVLLVQHVGGSGQIQYQWYSNTINSSVGGLIIPGAVNASYTVPSTGTSGTRYYYVKISDPLCGSSIVSTVAAVSTISSIQIQLLSSLQQTVCSGVSASINTSVQGGSADVNYQWYNNTTPSIFGGTPIIGATTNNILISGSVNAGMKYYYLIVTDNTCSVQAVSPVASVNTLTTPTIDPVSNRSHCNNDNIGNVAFSGNYPLAQYSWTNSNPLIGLPAAGIGNISNYILTNTSNMAISSNIQVTPISSGCIGNSLSFTITVNPTPTISSIANQDVCAGSSTETINFTTSIPGSTVQWQNSESSIGLSTVGSGNIPSFQTSLIGGSSILQANITAKPVSAVGCSGVLTAVTTIRVTPPIIGSGIDFAPISVCPLDSIEPLIANFPMGGNGVYSYLWQSSTDNINYSPVQTISSTNKKLYPPAQSSILWYRVVVASGACQSISTPVKVILKPKPSISITSNGINSVSIGNSYSVLANGGKSYIWTPSNYILNNTLQQVLLKPVADTRFYVKGYNEEGCSDTASIFIKVLYSSLIYPNNLLTPNNDGYNDKWIVKNLEFYPDNSIKLYNANGFLIKDFENYSNDWDGKVNGVRLPTAVYYFVITLKRDNTVLKGYLNIAN